MQTKVQNMQNYFGYMKCGEILKPPSESYNRPYVLKCFHCKEIYLLFEAFIFHIEDHCKDSLSRNKTIGIGVLENDDTETALQDHKMEKNQTECADGIEINDVNVKLEQSSSLMETEDPLHNLNPEWTSEDECFTVKEELKPTNDNIIHKNFNRTNRENSKSIELSDSQEIGNVITDIGSDTSYEEIDSDSDSNIEKVVKEKNKKQIKNPDINEFMKSKENVKVLISAYKNQPSLWNKSYQFLRDKRKRQACLEQIAQELKEQQDLSINWKLVGDIILFICRKHRGDLKELKGNKKYIPSWYFKDLDFLRPFMENNLIAKLDSNLPDLTSNQIIQILQIYKGCPHLWNTHLIEYYCKNKRYAAKQAMLEKTEAIMEIKISEQTLEYYIRTIHNWFRKTKREKLENNKNAKDIASEDNNQPDYYEHMIFLYDHDGKFKCSECPRFFKNSIYLKLHKTKLHGCDPLVCSLCNNEFKTAYAYVNHAKRHMEDLNFECKECGNKFLLAMDLQIHMRKHTGAKPFCCDICGLSFRHSQGLNSHRRRHEKEYTHTCHICNKGFYSKYRYNEHMNAHSNIRSQICSVCGKTFITKKSLRQHVVIHEDAKYACKLCGKTFKHKTNINQHMRIHVIAKREKKML